MPIARGEGHYEAKRTGLTENKVRSIRRRLAAGEPNAKLATEFGVSRALISQIRARAKWAWVAD